MLEFVTLHFFTILTFLVVFAAIGHLLTQRKKPSSMIAWSIAIIALPYLGTLLYIIFHGRKMDSIIKNFNSMNLKKSSIVNRDVNIEVEKLLISNGISAATINNRFVLCENGIDGYQKLISLLESANRSIYVSTYIFARDSVTKTILNILVQKANAGVEVKLLIDAFGSQSLEFSPFILASLKKAGGDYHFFMSMLKHPMNSKLNLRNHRKMIIVDSCSVLAGGINISDSYLSLVESNTLWMDLSFIIRGEAVEQYLEIFRHMWEESTKTTLEFIDNCDTVDVYGESMVQVVPSGPDIDKDALYEAILTSIYESRVRIWIMTPYFAPDSSLMDALIVAKHRGVDIKIISPMSSDHLFADIARSAFLRELAKEKIEILFYKNRMMHAKALLIDDKYVVLGSSNFDARSFFYNFEVVSFLYHDKDVAVVKDWIERHFHECESGLKEASKLRKIVENFFKMFAPAL